MNFQFYNPNGFKNIWIQSDEHAFHKNITKGVSRWTDKSTCRDFSDEVVMTEHMVKQINSVVAKQDVIITLGDWSFGGKQNIERFRSMINCSTIVKLIGNHDEWFLRDESQHKFFNWVGFYNEFWRHKTLFCQFHYPIISWNEMRTGSICLSGHVHGGKYTGRQLDCAIELYNYKPLHIDEIYDKMREYPIIGEGHHQPEGNL